MKRLTMALVLLAAACGGPHLGDGHGRRVRAALDANIAGKGGPAVVVGDDAKAILMRHRGLEQTETLYQSKGLSGSGASSGGSPSLPAPSSSSSSSSGGPRLDAIR
jgi:hypothetical protein